MDFRESSTSGCAGDICRLSFTCRAGQTGYSVCRKPSCAYARLMSPGIRDSKWSRPGSGIKIVPIITSRDVYSAGDAMRDIYTHGIITNDFVLVSGDLVSNIRIDEIVKVHKERRKTNKDAIMTMVVKEASAVHPTRHVANPYPVPAKTKLTCRNRPRGETSIFVMDAQTSECLHYEAVAGYPIKPYARIPREILSEHPELDIRNDLIDCYIDICSVEVSRISLAGDHYLSAVYFISGTFAFPRQF